MKKSIISMAVVAASIFSFGAMAQNPAAKTCDKDAKCTKTECPGKPGKDCDKKTCDKKPCNNPFEGLNLTTEQQGKLDQLRQQCAADRKAKAEERRTEARERRAERDSSFRAQRLANLKQIQSILTPDQYVTFLENIVVSGQNPMGPRFDRSMKPGKDKKPFGDKKGDKDHKDKKDKRGDRK
ncbi:MAG: hypothetical protein NC117_08240 [Pseudoflavonifractor sp.]|nr:hypothetical protein [Pseudoflavonifractor sp.]